MKRHAEGHVLVRARDEERVAQSGARRVVKGEAVVVLKRSLGKEEGVVAVFDEGVAHQRGAAVGVGAATERDAHNEESDELEGALSEMSHHRLLCRR